MTVILAVLKAVVVSIAAVFLVGLVLGFAGAWACPWIGPRIQRWVDKTKDRAALDKRFDTNPIVRLAEALHQIRILPRDQRLAFLAGLRQAWGLDEPSNEVRH